MPEWIEVEFAQRSGLRLAFAFLPFLCNGLVAVDCLALYCAGLLAEGAAGPWIFPAALGWPSFPDIVIFMFLFFLSIRLRDSRLYRSPTRILYKTFIGKAIKEYLIVMTGLTLVISPTLLSRGFFTEWEFSWFSMNLCWIIISRTAIVAGTRSLCKRDAYRRHIAVIGSEHSCERLAAAIGSKAGIIRAQAAEANAKVGEQEFEKLSNLGRGGTLDAVVVTAEEYDDEEVRLLIERLKSLPVQIAVSSRSERQDYCEPAFRLLGERSLAVVAGQPIRHLDLLLKTLMDRVGAACLILLLFPMLGLISFLVMLSGSNSIVYRQLREGWCGSSFTMFKFCTMIDLPEGQEWHGQTIRNDPRCTPFGRLLRRTSLDELPQLFNVLRGEMSLVGPRPHAPHLHNIDRAGQKIVAEYAQRHRVRPGLTGWAQIHGARGPTDDIGQMRRRVSLDLYYVEHWSFWLDLLILLRTPFCLIGENVY